MIQTEKTLKWLPWSVAGLCLLAYLGWLVLGPAERETVRVPKQWDRSKGVRKVQMAPDKTVAGPGTPSALPGAWPQFRGPARDNIATPGKPLPRSWPQGGPQVLWRVEVGEGHAGPAVLNGRVYLIDYDRKQKQDAIRCLSLDDGKEIWRTSYPSELKFDHGMSRTIPAVTDRFVVTISPKHHVYCCDAATGKVIWKKDLTAEYGARELRWYAGQCPLIDGDRVILAPGGKPLMLALDMATGREIWRTTERDDLGITHSSIAVMDFDGGKQYVYCAYEGVVGVDAASGKILWFHPDWKIKMATVAAPLVIDKERIFFSGGYGAGCQMVKLVKADGAIKVQELWRLKPTVFGADQQTPILYKDHIYGTIPPIESGELACLGLDGKRLWTSGINARFALGPYMMTADGLFLALNAQRKSVGGTLSLGTVDPSGYKPLASAKLLNGVDPWGPMALAGNRLILRDLTEMICVELGG